jgi:flavoprotein|tara:strand:+ start:72 stop:290 length:219 start_codon:yes stop_codon:yes gene_type:complete
MEDVRVKGHSDLVRDPVTNAIINTNKSKYEEYISRRDIKKSETQKVQDLEDELSCIKDDLNEIKSLLKEIIK